MPGPTEVSFKNLCSVFNTVGNQSAVKNICNEIYGEGDGAWKAAPMSQSFYQSIVGDGMAHFPQSGNVPNGIKQWAEFKYWNYQDDNPLDVMARATFLAGAFGLQEIPLKPASYSAVELRDTGDRVDSLAAALGVFCEDLPIELAEKLNRYYRECESDGLDVCMESKSANEVAKLWAPVAKCLVPPRGEETKAAAAIRELSCRLEQLKNNFSFVEKKITDKKDSVDFQRSIAPYLNELPGTPKTTEEYKVAINKYRGMVQMALRTVHGDWAKPEKSGIPNAVHTGWGASNPYAEHKWGLRND